MSGAPLSLVVALGAAALAVYVFLGRGVRPERRLLYLLLRGAGIAVLAVLLAAPERVREELMRRRHALALVLDASRSMQLPASPASPASRHDVLRQILEENAAAFEQIAGRFDLRVYECAGEATRQGAPPRVTVAAPPPAGSATALGDALLVALDDARGARLAGVVLLSDGVSNAGTSLRPAAAALAEAGVPVHTIAIGTAEALSDASVTALEVPPTGSVGKPLAVAARVRATGLAAREATLVVRAGGLEVERLTVPLDRGQTRREVRTTVVPRERGSLVIEAEVRPLEGERVVENNRRLAFAKIDDAELRVLYLEGVLRRDFGEIRRALAGASGFQVDVARAFLRGPALEPARWEQYDVFVLGEVGDGAVSAQGLQTLRRLVLEQGRGLVVCAGPRTLADPALAPLVPLRVTSADAAAPAKVRLAPSARGHPALGSLRRPGEDAPAVAGLAALGDRPARVSLPAGGEPLIAADDGTPVLVAGRAGAARAAVLASGSIHVWAADPAAPEGTCARLVRGLVAWAAGRESSRAVLSVELARHYLFRGDLVSVTARVNRARAAEQGIDDRALEALRLQARIEGPLDAPEAAREPRTFSLEPRGGEFAGSAPAGAGGRYRVVVEPVLPDHRIRPAETLFVVAQDEREFEALEADPRALAGVSDATGGTHVAPRDAGRVLAKLLGASAGTTARARRRESLWDRWWICGLFLLALSAEWWMRRR